MPWLGVADDIWLTEVEVFDKLKAVLDELLLGLEPEDVATDDCVEL